MEDGTGLDNRLKERLMRDKILTWIKGHKLLVVFLAAAIIKQLLVIGLPICPAVGTPCDDELMRDWAFSIAGFDWLGDFNAYTFMKEPGFAVFLAVCYRLHVPYIYAITFGYSVSCMIFSMALKSIFSSKKYVLCIYLVLLFHPISYCSTVLQKIYRNGLGVTLTLFVFGGLLHLYFSICQESRRKPLFWSAFTGLSLGYLWITKSDTVWILPFTVTICLVMFFMLLVKCRNFKSLPRYLCLILPFLGIFLCTNGVKFMHTQRYGISSIEYYGAAMDGFTHIKSGQKNEKILLSREQLRKLYEISPTLASVKEPLEASMDEHSLYDTHPEDDEVETGWLGWAFVRGFKDAGVYEDSEKANLFFKNLYQEMEAAFADGRLEKTVVPKAEKYYVDTPAHRRELLGRTLEAVAYMASYRKTSARLYSAENKKTEASVKAFERIARNANVPHSHKHDYAIEGWIVFPEYEGQKLNVYVEDEDGRRYKKLKFKKSEDVYTYLKDEYPELESARKCHFRTGWNIEDGKKDTSWYLGVYLADTAVGGKKQRAKSSLDKEREQEAGLPNLGNEQKVASVQIEETGFVSVSGTEFMASLDMYSSRQDEGSRAAVGVMAVKRLNRIRMLYRANGSNLLQISLFAYGVLTAIFLWGLRKKDYRCVNVWLIVTGLGLSVLVLAAGIAYVDLTQCPAIKTLYLSSGYPLLMSAELISLCKCAEMAICQVKKVREKTQYNMKKRIVEQI